MLSHVKLASNRERPRLAIIAHDGKKADLVAFATFNRSRLQEYDIVATGATARSGYSDAAANLQRLQHPAGDEHRHRGRADQFTAAGGVPRRRELTLLPPL
jgi:hypothetical protein